MVYKVLRLCCEWERGEYRVQGRNVREEGADSSNNYHVTYAVREGGQLCGVRDRKGERRLCRRADNTTRGKFTFIRHSRYNRANMLPSLDETAHILCVHFDLCLSTFVPGLPSRMMKDPFQTREHLLLLQR